MSQPSIHCYLTDHELAAKADQLIDELIKSSGKSWTMQVPAQPNADTNLIFEELNNRFKKISSGQAGAVWVKASIVPGKREIDYWCKLKSKKTGIEIRGAVLFSNSGVWVTDYEVLEYLDESGTAAGREEDAEKAQFDTLNKWLSDGGYTFDGEYYYDDENNFFTPDQIWDLFNQKENP